jgi:hypothetical protein
MNRTVHAQLKSVLPADPRPDEPVFLGGGARPNARFQELCELAGIGPRTNVETGRAEPWELKDLRKTCVTYYDAHVPESSVEILGHSVGGTTYRHYAHRAPLAFRAIMTLPQPTALTALARGFDGCARAVTGVSLSPRNSARGNRSVQRQEASRPQRVGPTHSGREPEDSQKAVRIRTPRQLGESYPLPRSVCSGHERGHPPPVRHRVGRPQCR